MSIQQVLLLSQAVISGITHREKPNLLAKLMQRIKVSQAKDTNNKLAKPINNLVKALRTCLGSKNPQLVKELEIKFKDLDSIDHFLASADIYLLNKPLIGRMNKAFLELDPDLVKQHMGLDFVVWNFICSSSDDTYANYLKENTNYKPEDLDASIRLDRHSNTFNEFKLGYKLYTGELEFDLNQKLQTIMKSNLKTELPEGINLDDFSIKASNLGSNWKVNGYSKYSKSGEAAKAIRNNKMYSPWQDDKLGLILCYKDLPTAIVSFSLNKRRILIKQLQAENPALLNDNNGIQMKDGKTLKVRPEGIFSKRQLLFDFRKILVDLTEEWARLHSIKDIGIQSGLANAYTTAHNPKGEVSIDKKTAIKIYDGTAKRLGYKLDGTVNFHYIKKVT